MLKVLYQLCFGKETVSTVEWVAYKFMDVIADDLMIRTKAVQNDVRQIDGFVMQMVGSDSQEDFILRIGMRNRLLFYTLFIFFIFSGSKTINC